LVDAADNEAGGNGAAEACTATGGGELGDTCGSHPVERWSKETGQGFSEAGEGPTAGGQAKGLQPVAES
jgi:hypothetical protein